MDPVASSETVLWRPLASSGFNIKRFIRRIKRKYGAPVADYESLWAWSTNPSTAPTFWLEVFDFLDIKASQRPTEPMIPNVRANSPAYRL